MQSFPATTGTTTLSLLVLVLVLLLSSSTSTDAHNITKILAKYPEFSTFNHYLSATHLDADINGRETITVCAVDNAAMSDLLSKHLSIFSIKNVLSFHVLLDYFGAKKLHQITNGTALAATMYQATGSASGSSGFVNITDLKGGKVGFAPEQNDGNLNTYFVKSVDEIPYNISVIQISSILPSTQAEAPTPGPSQINLTALMSNKGCKMFADLLTASGAIKTYEDRADGGLSIFCPTDGVLKGFMPKYKNLTVESKTSLLLYHGVPIYQSMAGLKSNNGYMNTLATDGGNNYAFNVQNDGDGVTLKTKVVTAKITGTILDEQPLVIYTIDKVLMPKELFNATMSPTPAPAPAPAPVADAKAPKASKGKAHKYASPPQPDSPDSQPAADQTAADSSGSVGFFIGGRLVALILSMWLGASLLV